MGDANASALDLCLHMAARMSEAADILLLVLLCCSLQSYVSQTLSPPFSLTPLPPMVRPLCPLPRLALPNIPTRNHCGLAATADKLCQTKHVAPPSPFFPPSPIVPPPPQHPPPPPLPSQTPLWCCRHCLQQHDFAVAAEGPVSAGSACVPTLALIPRNPTLGRTFHGRTLPGCTQQQHPSQQTLNLLPLGAPPEREP